MFQLTQCMAWLFLMDLKEISQGTADFTWISCQWPNVTWACTKCVSWLMTWDWHCHCLKWLFKRFHCQSDSSQFKTSASFQCTPVLKQFETGCPSQVLSCFFSLAILTWPACCSLVAVGSPEPWCCYAWPRGSGWTPSCLWSGGPGRRRVASAACHQLCRWTAAKSGVRSPCSREAKRQRNDGHVRSSLQTVRTKRRSFRGQAFQQSSLLGPCNHHPFHL